MTTTPYDKIAEWYVEWIRGFEDSAGQEWLALSTLMGDIGGQRVCDLACGHGRTARWLARAGASVIGVDISARLLDIAQREEDAEPLGITYVRDDAHHLSSFSDHSFDGVVCTWSLTALAPSTASKR